VQTRVHELCFGEHTLFLRAAAQFVDLESNALADNASKDSPKRYGTKPLTRATTEENGRMGSVLTFNTGGR